MLSGLHERVRLHGELASKAMAEAWAAAELEFQVPPADERVAFSDRVRQRVLGAAVGAVNLWREALSSQSGSPTGALRTPPVEAAGPAGSDAPLAGRARKRLRLLPPMRSGHLSEAEAQVDSIVASTALSPDRLQDAFFSGRPAADRQVDREHGSESPTTASPGPASSGSGFRATSSETDADGSWAASDDEDEDSADSDGFVVPDVASVLGNAAAGARPSIPEDWKPVVDRWAGEAAMSAVLGLGAGLPGSTVEACELRAAREAAGEMMAMAAVLAQWAVAGGHLAGPLVPPPPVQRSAKRDADGTPVLPGHGAAAVGVDDSSPRPGAGRDAMTLVAETPLDRARREAVTSLVAAYNRAFPRHSPFLMAADEREMSLLRHGPTMERVRSTASPAEAVAAVGLQAFPPQVHRRLLDTSTFRGLRFSLLGRSACIDPADSDGLDIARATRARLGDLDSWGRSLAGLLCAIRSMGSSAHAGVVFTETGVQAAWEAAAGGLGTMPARKRSPAAAPEAAPPLDPPRDGASFEGAAAADGPSGGLAWPGRGSSGGAELRPPADAPAEARAVLPGAAGPGTPEPAAAAPPSDIPSRGGDVGLWASFERTCDTEEAALGTPSEAGRGHGSSRGGEHGDLAPVPSLSVAIDSDDDDEASYSGRDSGRSGPLAGGSSGVPSPALELESGDVLGGGGARGGPVAIKAEARARWAGTPPQLFSQAMIARSHLDNLDDEGALLILSAARPDREYSRPREFLRRLLQTFTEEMLVAVFQWARQAVPERHWGTGLPGLQ